MLRGFPVQTMQLSLHSAVSVNPIELAACQEELSEGVFRRASRCVVKLRELDDADKVAGEFTGFLFTTRATLILSTNHIYVNNTGSTVSHDNVSSGATRFEAEYQDGYREVVHVVAQAENDVDALLLQGTRRLDTPLQATLAPQYEVVHVLGCPPGSAKVAVDMGVVAVADPGACYVTAHANPGCCGGPVVNKFGKLVGMMQGGSDQNRKYARMVPSELLHSFACEYSQTGLSG